MSSNEKPEYLKGVEQPGFNDQDNFTVRPGDEGPLGHKGYDKRVDDDFDDDDDTDERQGFRIPWPLILIVVIATGALGTLSIAAVAATRTWIKDAEIAALAEGGELSRVVVEERKIIDELGSRGANRKDLLAAFALVEAADGHEKGVAALQFTRTIDNAVATVGDVRGTPLDDRHKKLAYAQTEYVETLGSWQTASGNPLGMVAVGLGLVDGPPPY